MLSQEIVREWAKDKQRDKDRETKFQSIHMRMCYVEQLSAAAANHMIVHD